ncbi:hypothetical protein OIU77_007028 [Salix suchowensis]|uniref:Uncharacterized protein n=1 Tax=Salix suchowensis TaxID=1278906 RepID=A0ABQ9APA4_9ROSI|nr:hypothetical protein OIU77_007028 [Salix suchowensis]
MQFSIHKPEPEQPILVTTTKALTPILLRALPVGGTSNVISCSCRNHLHFLLSNSQQESIPQNYEIIHLLPSPENQLSRPITSRWEKGLLGFLHASQQLQ